MSGYEKRILYFDEIENGRKVRNAGFTKLILQGEQCRLSVNISGLHKTDTIKCDLMLLEDEKEVTINRIDLQQGRCSYSCLLTREQMGEKGIQLEDAYGICVRLSEQRFLKAVWRERRMDEPQAAEEVVDANERKSFGAETEAKDAAAVMSEIQEAPKAREMTEEQPTFEVGGMPADRSAAQIREMPGAEKEPEVHEVSEMPQEPEVQRELKMYIIPEKQELSEAQKQSERYEMPQTQQTTEIGQPTEVQKPTEVQADMYERPERDETARVSSKRISDDKWQQLERVFPLIHPFGDEREYLSIAPKDFIVLTREYQALANNSFLLHGFYNYHHIILGKIPLKGKDRFFLGVPGVFYEREKAVAVMFGFESFECAKEPADTGTFGYYMKRVEI